MTPSRFLENRESAWIRLETLLGKCNRRGLGGLEENELHELARLYTTIVVDVSQARMYQLDPKTQQRLNNLAIRAHGLLYRRPHVPLLPVVGKFFMRDYPVLFRRLWPYMAISVTLFVIGFLGSYTSTRCRPATAYLFVPGDIDLPDGHLGLSAEDVSERFRKSSRPPMAAGIITNNISVAFNAFALGITAGVGTCYLVLYNAMMLGGFAGHFANHDLHYPFWSFIAPHGVLEILTILIAAAAGLRLGFSLVIPGHWTRRASLNNGAREAVLLVLGTIPMFIAAGIIEGFITPSELDGRIKIAIGLTVGAVAMLYLLLGGRTRHRESRMAPPQP